MKTVLLGARPPEVDSYLARRRALGQDLFDEMWEDEYHVAPAASASHGYIDNVLAELLGPLARQASLVGTGPFNLGGPQDYRVPDRGYHRSRPSGVWVATAAIVIEVVSPDDETWAKFDFYARHDVDEIATAEPATHQLRWFSRQGADYEETGLSILLGRSAAAIDADIDWPS